MSYDVHPKVNVNFSLVRTADPAVEPILLNEVKKQCRVELDYDYEDEVLTSLVRVAREMAENYTRRAFITQSWTLTLDCWPGRVVTVPIPPLQEVTAVKYIDSAGTEQTMVEGTDYDVDLLSTPGRIYPSYSKTWPTLRAHENVVTVEFTAGYGDAASDVPEPIVQAMKLMITHWYENRGVMVPNMIHEMPMAANYLLFPYRDLRF
jgi:uncharacterized phiE125 gp8 family phage protein